MKQTQEKRNIIKMTRPAFIREHVKLVKILKKDKKVEILKEARDQSRELKKVKKRK
jgi:hypothetical protein